MQIGTYHAYAAIEEQIMNEVRRLRKDPEMRRIRWGAVEYVRTQLSKTVAEQLCTAGISPELEEAYLRKEAGSEEKVAEAIRKLKIPQIRQDQFLMAAILNRKDALQILKTYLVDKAMTAFGEGLGVSSATWSRFANCSGYTSTDTAEKIAAALELKPKERLEFLALVIREWFTVNDDIKKELRTQVKARGMKLSQFCNLSLIGKKAWEPFRKNSTDAHTSQGTLLKMVIGLRHSQKEAESFLGTVNSRFVMLRDLVVLACLRCRVYEIGKIRNILEHYATEGTQEPRFKNLY